MELSENTRAAWIPALAIVGFLILDRILNIVERIMLVANPNWLELSISQTFWPELVVRFVLTLIVAALAAFLANFYSPIATRFKIAWRLARPSLWLYLTYIAVVTLVFIADEPAKLEAMMIGVVGFLIYYVPQAVLLMATVAVFGWLGARVAVLRQPSGSGARPGGSRLDG